VSIFNIFFGRNKEKKSTDQPRAETRENDGLEEARVTAAGTQRSSNEETVSDSSAISKWIAQLIGENPFAGKGRVLLLGKARVITDDETGIANQYIVDASVFNCTNRPLLFNRIIGRFVSASYVSDTFTVDFPDNTALQPYNRSEEFRFDLESLDVLLAFQISRTTADPFVFQVRIQLHDNDVCSAFAANLSESATSRSYKSVFDDSEYSAVYFRDMQGVLPTAKEACILAARKILPAVASNAKLTFVCQGVVEEWQTNDGTSFLEFLSWNFKFSSETEIFEAKVRSDGSVELTEQGKENESEPPLKNAIMGWEIDSDTALSIVARTGTCSINGLMRLMMFNIKGEMLPVWITHYHDQSGRSMFVDASSGNLLYRRDGEDTWA